MSQDRHPVQSEDAQDEYDRPAPYDILRTAILDGVLAPGTVVSQAELSAMFDIGRTPLREAARRLQSDGLLEVNPRRRLRVAPLSADDLAQLYTMRIPLESLAVRITVPQLSDEEIAAAAASLARHVDACNRGDLADARGPHREFHLMLYSKCGPRILAQVEALWDQAERYRRMYVQGSGDEIALMQLAAHDHTAILEAATVRDALLCSELVARHLTRTALTIFARLDDSHGPDHVRAALELVRFGSTAPPIAH